MHFPDYTVDEMMGIFNLRMKKAGYELDPEAVEPLRELLEEKSEDIASFGNARGVRNLFEQAISRQANRLAGKQSISREELMLLTKEDIIPEDTKAADK